MRNMLHYLDEVDWLRFHARSDHFPLGDRIDAKGSHLACGFLAHPHYERTILGKALNFIGSNPNVTIGCFSSMVASWHMTVTNLPHQMAKNYLKSFDKFLAAMVMIGDNLPKFQNYTDLFKNNDSVKSVLCLFYKDLLEFHSVFLKFLKLKSKFSRYVQISIPSQPIDFT